MYWSSAAGTGRFCSSWDAAAGRDDVRISREQRTAVSTSSMASTRSHPPEEATTYPMPTIIRRYRRRPSKTAASSCSVRSRRYFGNKVGVREVSRVLRDDGLAKIDAELRPDLPSDIDSCRNLGRTGLCRSSTMRRVSGWHSSLLPRANTCASASPRTSARTWSRCFRSISPSCIADGTGSNASIVACADRASSELRSSRAVVSVVCS